MPDWLTKAQNALGGRPAGPPEPFEIECPCGGAARGQRETIHQRVRCLRCGETFFVLPRSVYPRPRPRMLQRGQSSPSSGASQKTEKTETTARPSEPVQRKVATLKGGVHRTVRQGSARSRDWAERSLARQRAFWTPLRLVALCLTAAVLATLALVIHRSHLRDAEKTLATAQDNGYTALREGDFGTAAREFQRACEALEVLGRDGVAARKLRQMNRESTAASGLTSLSLLEIFQNLGRIYRENPSNWRGDFQRRYGDRWVVLDAPVRRIADGAAPATFAVEYPLLVAGKPVRIEVALPALESLGGDGEPRRAIVAGQLGHCRLTDPIRGRWVVTLRPETAFLWAEFENYRRLGFDVGEGQDGRRTRELLDQQAQIIGIEP